MSRKRVLTKSPKHKLKLIKEDGKSYIRKKDLDHYFFEQGMTREDFKFHFGIGHRIMTQSLYKYYTKDQIKRSQGEKIAKIQRENNSNRVNWYKPANLVEVDKIKEAISTSLTHEEAMEKLGMSKYVFSHHLQYYNLAYNETKEKSKKFLSLTTEEVELLKSLMFYNKQIGLLFSRNSSDIIKGIDCINDFKYTLFNLVRKLKRINRKHIKRFNIRYSANNIEYQFYKYFKHLKLDVEAQFPLGPYKYDFFFPKFNLLLELDGSLHEINRDLIKDELAANQGYKVIRIKLSKSLLNKAYDEQTIFKKIKSCINQYQLFQ